jgi:hypothetical protein
LIGEEGLTFGVAGRLGAEAHLAVQNRRRGDIFASAAGRLEATAFNRRFSIASFYTGLTAGEVTTCAPDHHHDVHTQVLVCCAYCTATGLYVGTTYEHLRDQLIPPSQLNMVLSSAVPAACSLSYYINACQLEPESNRLYLWLVQHLFRTLR